jgi:uncharacterized membrane protein (DUF2068 family)
MSGSRAASTSQVPIRAVAAFEASKGVLVLLAGLGALSWHRGLQRAVDVVIGHLHLNPAKHHPHVFEVVARDASSHMVLLTVGAATYVLGRFVEAFGLWGGRRWAVWLAASTAAIYLPFELVELARRPNMVAVAALALNLVIVVYLLLRRPRLDLVGQPGG